MGLADDFQKERTDQKREDAIFLKEEIPIIVMILCMTQFSFLKMSSTDGSVCHICTFPAQISRHSNILKCFSAETDNTKLIEEKSLERLLKNHG